MEEITVSHQAIVSRLQKRTSETEYAWAVSDATNELLSAEIQRLETEVAQLKAGISSHAE